MHIILNNDSLLDYFPGVKNKDLLLFHHSSVPGNFTVFDPYTFLNRDSDMLLVTSGDSWTWGMDLAGHSDLDQFDVNDWEITNGIISNINNDRLTKVFGNLVSKTNNSDWLNLSIPGHGNFHMAELINHLANLIPKLHYKKIYVVCTLTEVGRWFNTEDDLFLDHNKLMDLVESTGNVNDLLAELNRLALNQIINNVGKFDHVTLLVGTNFVDPVGFENLKPVQILKTPWYQLLDISYDHPFYMSYGLGLSNFIRAVDDGMVPKKLQSIFKKWIMDSLLQCDQFDKQIRDSIYFSNNSHHPIAAGHTIWADYVTGHIIC